MKPTLQKLQQQLEQTSKELNLFSAGDRLKIGDKHLPDSVAVLDFWTPADGSRVMDIGTGGGLPGLALALSHPKTSFTLVDAREKKVRAVRDMAEELGLENVRTVAGRFEELARETKYREQFDVVTARAVASLPLLLEYAAGFLKVGGSLYAWKGPDYETELKQAKIAQAELGLVYKESFAYELPGAEARVILRFEKTKKLHPAYPRRTGVPSSNPLVSK